MAPLITSVSSSDTLPTSTGVVVIGGGIVGLVAALVLRERGIPVLVLEKGRIAGEQSSRNLGWIRKMGRSVRDVPLSVAADRLWSAMSARVGRDVGYKNAGIMYLARTEAEMEMHRAWLRSVKDLMLDSRLLTAFQINDFAPGGREQWAGGRQRGGGRAVAGAGGAWRAGVDGGAVGP